MRMRKKMNKSELIEKISKELFEILVTFHKEETFINRLVEAKNYESLSEQLKDRLRSLVAWNYVKITEKDFKKEELEKDDSIQTILEKFFNIEMKDLDIDIASMIKKNFWELISGEEWKSKK